MFANQLALGQFGVLHRYPCAHLLLSLSHRVRDWSKDLLQIRETGLETKLGPGHPAPCKPIHSMAGVLPALQRARGPADDALGLVAGYFTLGQLSCWAVHTLEQLTSTSH